jgi:hypothetical protein
LKNAIIEHVPCSDGDSYYLILEDGRNCAVRNFAKMEQVKNDA